MRSTQRPSWRDYQAGLQRQKGSRKFAHSSRRFGIAAGILAALVFCLIGGARWTAGHYWKDPKPESGTVLPDQAGQPSTGMCKRDLQRWLSTGSVLNLEARSFDHRGQNQTFRIDTSLNLPLQTYLIEKTRRSKSHQMGVVAMDPSTGKVLAMTGKDLKNPEANPCVNSAFPAASIFKIVTAAAVMESSGLDPGSNMTFNGGKYTLYKSQLKKQVNRYTNKISFRDSFAQSINPVFGK
ncbi:MAG: hypothetical protein JRH15_05215, partial [Deltaproteobacteria bacterium]|nr:hypothetical protein [Deltaproteobacteria bacterium]